MNFIKEMDKMIDDLLYIADKDLNVQDYLEEAIDYKYLYDDDPYGVLIAYMASRYDVNA